MDRKKVAYKVRQMKQKEFHKELLRKVGEEASAVTKVKTKKELVEELADLLTVVEEVKKQKKITDWELQTAIKDVKKSKGMFKKRYFLSWSGDDSYKTNERR